MKPSTFVLWDIDGTLLTTGRAGVFALERAAREVGGANPEIQNLPAAGLTDAQIAVLVLQACGSEATEELVHDFLRVYERELPNCLPKRRGCVLPGVQAILADLAAEQSVLNLLLTGNTAAGAEAKLHHYGLSIYFRNGGAFCGEDPDREQIARAACALIEQHLGEPPCLERVFVVGDTPHDIRCGQAVEARTIAVATGDYGLAELEACGPWFATGTLPPPVAFRSLLAL